MKFDYVVKDFRLGDWQKERIEEKLRRLDKYFDENVEAKVNIEKIGNQEIVEVTIKLQDAFLRAEESSDSIFNSVDQAIDGLVSQIRKYKTKLQKRYQKNESIRFESFEDLDDEEEEKKESKIVKVKRFNLRPMSPEEAVLQMELLGHDFFVFLDGDSFEMAIVYKRKKGDYGLIQAEID